MLNDGCCYGIDASNPRQLTVVLRQGRKTLLHRRLAINAGNVAALMDLIHQSRGKPRVCINSTGETALALAFTIIDNIPHAEVMLAFPAVLRHATSTTDGQEGDDSSGFNAELFARQAERLIQGETPLPGRRPMTQRQTSQTR